MQNQLPARIPTYVREKILNAIVPVVYTEAVNQIAKLRDLMEGKHWANKIEALAAWAKMYKNDEVGAEAKRLKAYLYRRMSQVAEELSPRRPAGIGKGSSPGPQSKLIEAGLTPGQAQQARRIGFIPEDKFNEAISQKKPPGTSRLAFMGRGKGTQTKGVRSAGWGALAYGVGGGAASGGAFLFRNFCRKNPAHALGKSLLPGETLAAKALIKELHEWLDELEESLPPADGGK